MRNSGGAFAGGDLVALALASALAGAVGVVWAGGGLAGQLFGEGWPHLGFDQLVGVLARLPGDLGTPRLAWPSAVRGELPSGTATLACVIAVGLLGVLALGLMLRVTVALHSARSSSARWATSGDLRVLRPKLMRDRGGASAAARLVLGRHRGRVLYGEQRHALVVFGPPQSGKSAGLAIPALLEWPGPAIASSIKADLLSATLARRRSLGEVMVYDPFELSGVPAQRWSPLRLAHTWEGALEAAWRLAQAGELDSRGVEGGDFWGTAAEQRLAPLLYAAAHRDALRGMEKVLGWAYGQGLRELDEILEHAAGAATAESERLDAQAAYEAVRAFNTQADRTRSSIEATAQALLRAYRFARVARSSHGFEITPERLLDGPRTLYLIGDAKASKLLRPLFLALLSELVDAAYARANAAGGRLERPLLICLDEAGNVAPLPNLAEIASTAPSHNIQLVSIFHDLEQARSRYGQQAATVVNSHRARMLLPGVADLETLRCFSGLAGEEESREVTRTSGAGGASRSTGLRRRPLAAPEALRQLPEGSALLIYGRLAPVRLRLRRWFEDRPLRRLAEGGPRP